MTTPDEKIVGWKALAMLALAALFLSAVMYKQGK